MVQKIGRWLGLLGLVAAAAAFGVGIGSAAVPDADGEVHACFNNNRGTWRVIDPEGTTGLDTACKPDRETQVDLLGATGKAADSDKLDGNDSTDFASIGRSATSAACNPSSSTFVTCASTGTVTLPRTGRVLLIGASEWDNNGSAAPNNGACRLLVDGTTVVGPEVRFGEVTTTHNITFNGSVALTAVTGALSAGSHMFMLQCRETTSDVFLTSSTISMVLLASS